METEIKYIDNLCVKITDGSHFSPEDDEKGQYPMYSVKDMEYNSFSNQDCKHIGQDVFDKLSRQDCRPLKDDIVIAKDGSYLKYVFKVKEDLDACILSSIAILRPNKKVIDPDYFVYLMRSASVKNAMANYVSGSALPRIILSDFKKMKIAICSDLNKQKHIASILSAYDSQIENNQKRIKLLEQMAENLYKEWFVRFRFPGYENAEFEGGVPKGWVSLVGDNKKPKGWTYGELNQLGTFIRGKNITAAEMIEGQVPVISAGLEPAGYHNQANVCGPCLTISSSGANAGYLKYNLTDIWAADCSYYNNPDNIWFVYSSLKYLQPVISNLQCGAAQPHVYPKDVNRLCVILPPKSLITEYNRQSSLFFKNIHNLKNQIFLLTHQRDLLLPRLMSGKLSI